MATAKYLARRFAFLLLVVWCAATINFFLPRLSGRDPVRARLAAQAMKGVSIGKGIDKIVETYDKKFGLDVPLTQQYINYLGDLTRFDLGPSFSRYPMRVSQLIGATLPWTLGLLLTSTVFSFGRDHGHYGRIMNQTVVVEQSLHVRNDHEITGFCFTPQDGNSILSSISAAEWMLYPHSYEDKIQCLKPYFYDEV